MKMKLINRIWSKIENLIICIMEVVLRVFHIRWNQKQWDKFIEFVKFCMVGLSSAVVMYGTYVVIWILTENYYIANIVGFIFSTTNSFFWNSHSVFKFQKKSWSELFLAYLKTLSIYALTGLVFSNILLFIWVEKCRIPELIAPFINIIIVTPANYILNRCWAFQKK